MVQLISKEWSLGEDGEGYKRCVYLASEGDLLPDDAPIGSRALFDSGVMAMKTPVGWERE